MEHPITPPPYELVGQWVKQWQQTSHKPNDLYVHIATAAAQWGADQELDACCEWVNNNLDAYWARTSLRAARRPKTPSLKEQAFRELGDIYNDEKIDGHAYNTIRQALEALSND